MRARGDGRGRSSKKPRAYVRAMASALGRQAGTHYIKHLQQIMDRREDGPGEKINVTVFPLFCAESFFLGTDDTEKERKERGKRRNINRGRKKEEDLLSSFFLFRLLVFLARRGMVVEEGGGKRL